MELLHSTPYTWMGGWSTPARDRTTQSQVGLLSPSGNRFITVLSRWPLHLFFRIRWVSFVSSGLQGSFGTVLAQTFLDPTHHVFESECQCGPMHMSLWADWIGDVFKHLHGHMASYLKICIAGMENNLKTKKDGQPLKYYQRNPTLIVMGKQKVTPTIQNVSIGQNQTRMRLKLENTIFECVRDTG